jgi:hypothetical protein
MSPNTFSQIVLRERPVAGILPDTFETKTKAFDELHVGKSQALVQITYLSLDPAMRGWIKDARSYLPPVQIGEVMRSAGLGVVVSVGEASKFQKGDMVYGFFGASAQTLLFSQPRPHVMRRMDRVCSCRRQVNGEDLVRFPSPSVS